MVVETIEGYTCDEFINDMFHTEEDPLSMGEQWVMDGNIYVEPSKQTPIKIKITVEVLGRVE